MVCTDEYLLHPDPFPDRAAWCAARVRESARRLRECDPQLPTVLVNHWPLTRLPTRVLRHPEFALWCGTVHTADWHRRYRATAVVYGHLHIPRVTWEDGVRFVEASLGYPREWQPRERRDGTAVADLLPRQVLPAPAESAPATRLSAAGPDSSVRTAAAGARVLRSVQRPGPAAQLGRGERRDVDPPESGGRRAQRADHGGADHRRMRDGHGVPVGRDRGQPAADPGQQLDQPLAAVRGGVRLAEPGPDRVRLGRGDRVQRRGRATGRGPSPAARARIRAPARARSPSPGRPRAGARRARCDPGETATAGPRSPTAGRVVRGSSSGSSAGNAVPAVAAVGAWQTRVRRALTGPG